MDIPFIPGVPPPNPGPLARFLPPLPEGVASAYLKRYTQESDLVLDPFGQSPRVAIEAAFLGRRVLVAVNNPINRFVLEMAANPPDPAELRSVLARLAGARKDGARLEVHMGEIYSTDCRACGRRIQAEYFVWEKEAHEPSACAYICPHCGASGEHPATQADVELAQAYGQAGWHHSLALERVAPLDDPDREHAEEALAVYPARALYSLFTLLNKLEGLDLSSSQRRLAEALMLSAMDSANSLWGHPDPRPRPRSLTVATRFRENNVWLALERAVNDWTFTNKAFATASWPPSGPSADIYIFEGPIRDLMASLQTSDSGGAGLVPAPIPARIACALAVLPRPNQAFWSMSALWAGWLWGREAAASFKSVLRRRRYDWNWHATALQAAGESMSAELPEGIHWIGLMPEAEPGFTAAALAAFDAAGFALQGRALRADMGDAQWVWQRRPKSGRRPEISDGLQSVIQQTGAAAAREVLQKRAEPARWATLHAAGWSELARRGVLTGLFERGELSPLPFVNEALEQAISDRKGFLRFGGGEVDRESGQWWLEDEESTIAPLADRVEAEVHRRLAAESSGITEAELDEAVCAEFPGLLTPAGRLVAACLRSYGFESESGSGEWRLRPEDALGRAQELEAIREMLIGLGHHLEYDVTGAVPLEWRSSGGVVYTLAVISSAAISHYLLDPALSPARSLLVLPGGRAALAQYKLKRDPRLRQAAEKGWRFVKYRLVRRLAGDTALTRENLEDRLKLDPLGETEAQLSLF